MEIRSDVLALVAEPILEPERRIIDPHHHVFDTIQGFPAYSLADLRADAAGHRVEKTVFLQRGTWRGEPTFPRHPPQRLRGPTPPPSRPGSAVGEKRADEAGRAD
jgi:hypothetical protein